MECASASNWKSQRVRKKIDDKRNMHRYYKKKSRQKLGKIWKHKLKIHKRRNGIGTFELWQDLDEDQDWIGWDSLLSDELDILLKLLSKSLPEIAMRFAYCWRYWKGDVIAIDNTLPKYIPTYQEYLHCIPDDKQFKYEMNTFKPIFKKGMKDMFYTEYIDVNCDDHTFWVGLQRNVFKSFMHCGYCQQCVHENMDLLQVLLNFVCYDLEPLIWEIYQEIQLEQQNYIQIINQYNQINSKQNWNNYIRQIINIPGISFDICDIILTFVSNEYPVIENHDCIEFKKLNYFYFRRSRYAGCGRWNIQAMYKVSFKWVDQNDDKFCRFCRNNDNVSIKEFMINNSFPNLCEPKYIYIFHEYEILIGRINYPNDQTIYFYLYSDCSLEYIFIFSRNWPDLYNIIGNDSIKIHCYSFLFEDVLFE